MIEVRRLSFRYPASTSDALRDVDWRVAASEFTLLAGQSGSGKSTLLRALNGLIPHFHGGYFSGEVIVFGRNTRDSPPRQLAGSIGTVFQDPEAQLITDTAEDEIFFTLDNLGFGPSEIQDRIDAVCRDLGIDHLRKQRISTLSGGERQLAAIAAALAPSPRALLLDEPTSQLDPSNAQTVIDALADLNEAGRLAIILAEHRLQRLLDRASSIAHLNQGRIDVLTPAAASPVLAADGLLPPGGAGDGLGKPPAPGDLIVSMEDLGFGYGREDVLSDVNLQIREGEAIALAGPNGSGKTTLLKQIIGLLRPDRGVIRLDGRPTERSSIQDLAQSIGYVPQQPSVMLHQETVADELQFTLAGLGREGDIEDTLAAVGLSGYALRHPLDLSGGERQRLAIAAIAVARPRLLLLDEPTRGLPWSSKLELALVLRALAARGTAILVATHDDDFRRVVADRTLHLDGGRLVADVHHDRAQSPSEAEIRYVTPLLTGSNLD